MPNIESFQFFILPAVDEGMALHLLGDLMGMPIESMDAPLVHAKVFAQVSSYPEGFEQGFLISWPRDEACLIDQSEVVKKFSDQLKVSALLEPNNEGDGWLLFSSKGAQTVAVRYLSDGIDAEIIC